MRSHIAHAQDMYVWQFKDTGVVSVGLLSQKVSFFCFFSITDNCCKATSSCQLCFTVSADVLNEERYANRILILFICVVFSNAVLRWKNASALPGQSSGSKGFFSVKWNSVKICVTEIIHLSQLQVYSCFCLFS